MLNSDIWLGIFSFSSMTGELQLEPAGERNPSDSDPLLENHTDSFSPASSSEIRTEDIENGSAPSCRICLECDGEEGRVSSLLNFFFNFI